MRNPARYHAVHSRCYISSSVSCGMNHAYMFPTCDSHDMNHTHTFPIFNPYGLNLMYIFPFCQLYGMIHAYIFPHLSFIRMNRTDYSLTHCSSDMKQMHIIPATVSCAMLPSVHEARLFATFSHHPKFVRHDFGALSQT